MGDMEGRLGWGEPGGRYRHGPVPSMMNLGLLGSVYLRRETRLRVPPFTVEVVSDLESQVRGIDGGQVDPRQSVAVGAGHMILWLEKSRVLKERLLGFVLEVHPAEC